MHHRRFFSMFLFGLCGPLSALAASREYYFIPVAKNWSEAQSYCRAHYSDLATFRRLEDSYELGISRGWSWIGLYDDPASWKGEMTADPNSWRWSSTGNTSPGGFQNWSATEPNYRTFEEKCVALLSDGSWMDRDCNEGQRFVCHTGTGGEKRFDVGETLSTWREAVTHCRASNSELATIESFAENMEVAGLMKSYGVVSAWIGLYREPWRWSDNTPVRFTNWDTVSDPRDKHCASETPAHVSAAHLWAPHNCSAQQPFFCHKDVTVKKEEISSNVLKICLSSGLDLSDSRNSRMVQQKIQEALDKAGHTGVKVSWKTPPKKKSKTFNTEL